MTPLESFSLKNRMLFYNIFTNSVGAWIVILLSFRSISPPFYEIADFAHQVNLICIPIFYLFIFIGQIIYELPIRKYLNSIRFNQMSNDEMKFKAKRRLLNAPFVIIGIDLLFWILGAIVYFFLYTNFTANELAANRVFFQNALVGLISATATYFVLEQVLQRSLVPSLFPEGGLYMTPKTARIRISTRFTAFIFAVNLIPFFALLVLVQGTYGTNLSAFRLLEHIRSAIVTNSLISIVVGICLTVLVSVSLSRPLREIISALKRVHAGDLNGRIKVVTNDEVGYAGDVINEMTQGLKERERMKHSLELAKEVQLRLLPAAAPKFDALDVAGVSLYCDETGGDYFDYLNLHETGGRQAGIVVGDVSDHGVHSALLMTTARAFIRLRASMPGSMERIVSDVNRHLTIDIEDGGQFMTLFFLSIDMTDGTLRWIRAGHDPAALYDPAQNRIEELKGTGIPLGIDADFQYQASEKSGLCKGQVIVLCTDGVWEARNEDGEIFGKDLFYGLIMENAHRSAASMLNTIVGAIKRFQDGARTEDDITMVVIKVEADLRINGD
jgi:sigma-B regulation protein RsbU (phosphoserine phosphatase)